METVIYVAVALVAGVAVGKYVLGGGKQGAQIRIPLGAQTQLGVIYVSVSARETILWTGPDAVTGFGFGLNGTKNVYPQARILGRDLDSGALSTTATVGDSCDYTITTGTATSSRTYNGRIIIQH